MDTVIRRAAGALALVAIAGCTVHQTEPPPSFAGPSGFALTLSLSASPNSINQDGSSTSTIKVTAIGPDGRPKASVPLRLDTSVDGVPADFGTLSSRTVVTGSDGTASVVFTAPLPPQNGVFGTCGSLPGTCVSVIASPTDCPPATAGTACNFQAVSSESVQIRLMPPGLISSPAPVPDFKFEPASPQVGSPVLFDAFTSCGGPLIAGACPGTRTIATYLWNFGDGQTGSGQTVTHAFGRAATYTVTLTVTNDLGASASKPQLITVLAPDPPGVDFVFGPTPAQAGSALNFTSTTTTPSGAAITSYSWNFGDGTSATGSSATKTYPPVGASGDVTTYHVTLTVRDSNNVTATSTKDVAVKTP